MGITPIRLRVILRWMHIIFGLVVLCYIYSPFNQYRSFQIIIKLIVIPGIVLSGIWLWKFQKINHFFKIVENP